MLEIYFDSRGEVEIENYEKLLRKFPDYAERAMTSAMKSEGFRLKKIIQKHIKTRGSGQWKKLNPHTGIVNKAKGGSTIVKNYKLGWKGKKGQKKRRRIYWESKTSTRTAPLFRLAAGVRYHFDKESMGVSIGFVNPKTPLPLWSLAHKHAFGDQVQITPRMRRFLFAMGFPVKKSTKTLEIPKRQTIEPVFEAEKENIFSNLETKFFKNIERYRTGSQKSD